jgi:hypothetical protein
MLYNYQQQVQKLLWDVNQQLMRPADIASWINTARNQVAGEAQCVRVYSTLTLAINTTVYPFSSISVGSGYNSANYSSPLNVRTMWYLVGGGQKWIRPRPFGWFSLYQLNNPVPQNGAPQVWSQMGQGVSGTIFISPIPNQNYVLNLDTVWLPAPLASDATIEIIPYPWTDAVPYFAAYLGYLSGQKPDMAKNMLDLYSQFTQRARAMSTSDVLPGNYEQVPSPTTAASYGMQSQSGQNG